jgi:general secretion pathway protein J
MMAPGRAGFKYSGALSYQSGFTLIELMVGLAIFALLGSACYQFLSSMTLSQGSLQAATDQRWGLAKALIVIDQDMRQLIPRSVRSMDSEARSPAVDGRQPGRLEFSRTGFPQRQSLHVVGARRISYLIETEQDGPTLYREVYAALDRVQATPAYRQALLQGVAELGFRFMNDDGQWVSQWPPEGEKEDQSSADVFAELPLGIELTIDLSSGQTIQRFVSLR